MSALMTARRDRDRRRAKRRPEAAQDSLFAAVAAPATPAPEAVAAPPATEAIIAPPAPDHETSLTASAPRRGPTLDDLVAGAWEGLLAGAPADCIACGTPVTPRHSAGAGVVGGRCGGCGTTLA